MHANRDSKECSVVKKKWEVKTHFHIWKFCRPVGVKHTSFDWCGLYQINFASYYVASQSHQFKRLVLWNYLKFHVYVYMHDYTDNTIAKHFSLCLSDSQKTFLHTSKNHLNNLLMHIIDFGLLEMLSFTGNFICKPSGYTYTKSYVKHPNENIYALQRQMFGSDLGWQLSRFLALPHVL